MKAATGDQEKVLLFANTTWYLYNFRLQLASDLRAAGYQVVLASPRDEYVERIREEGFEWLPFEITRRGLNPWVEIRSFLAILRVYRQRTPDLVCHFTLKSVLYGSIAARLAGVRAVVNAVTGLGYLYSHQSFSARLQRAAMLFLLRYGLNHPNSYTVFQNDSDRDEFLRSRVTREPRTAVIPGSGVDLEVFRQGTGEESGSPDVVQVVMVSRMLWDKGVGELVEAARLLLARGCRVRFLLAGAVDEGNPESVSMDDLQGWQAEGLITWAGFVDDVPALLHRSDIVVLPSKYREGVPRSLIEAAAAGKPAVTTDVPGCTDIVHDGYNGVIVPAGDAQALAGAIERLTGDPALRRQMGEAGLELVARSFSVEQVNRQLIRFMESLLY